MFSAFLSLAISSAPDSNLMKFSLEPQTEISRVTRMVVDNGRWSIYASGPIDEVADLRLQGFIREHGIEWAIVYFDSPGGSLSGGIELGEVIRHLQFDTGIGSLAGDGRRIYSGTCASSCAYAFAGGVNRYIYGDDQRIGIHQFYASGDNRADIGDTQSVSGLLLNYLQRMGIDPTALSIASVTPGSSMAWLTPKQALDLRLANNGAKPTSAEIKLAGQVPYLRLEQQLADVTTRVLIACDAPRKLSLAGGIVTTPELTTTKGAYVQRSYLEFDDSEVQPVAGSAGVHPADSTLWVKRVLTSQDVATLLLAKNLGIWTEDGSDFRWGATMDLTGTQSKIAEFASNCF